MTAHEWEEGGSGLKERSKETSCSLSYQGPCTTSSNSAEKGKLAASSGAHLLEVGAVLVAEAQEHVAEGGLPLHRFL
jgi:hypothetical protein